MERNRRYAVPSVDRNSVGSDRRRAGAAVTNAENRGVPVRLDLFPELRVVVAVIVSERNDAGLDTRHMLREPGLDLFEQLDRIVEPAVDQVDGLAVQRVEPRCGRLLGDLWRVTDRVEDRDLGLTSRFADGVEHGRNLMNGRAARSGR